MSFRKFSRDEDTQLVTLVDLNGNIALKPYDRDSFGRLKVSNPETLFQNKNIHDKARSLWEEPIAGAIVVHGAVTGGPFQTETVRGQTSLIEGVVTTVGAGNLTLTVDHNDFIDGETLLGLTSGATAAITTHNTGSDIIHLTDEAAVELKVGTASGDYAMRQTHKYHTYIPGKSQNIIQTFVMGAQKANVVKRAGYFDDHNGLFFEQTETDIAFVIRSDATGSIVDTRHVQGSWSEDNLDGTGDAIDSDGEPIVIDSSLIQVLNIDFQWLGAGHIRFGFDIEDPIEAHIKHHANEVDAVYMAEPSLPLRYEIRNVGATASATIMKEICGTVISDGGSPLPGIEHSTPIVWADERVTSTTETPMLAIRLKDQFSAAVTENRRVVKLSDAGLYATGSDTIFKVYHVHDPFNITATWDDVGEGTGVEYSTDISAITGRPRHLIDVRVVNAGGSIKADTGTLEKGIINEHGFISQNFDSTNSQIFLITAATKAGAGTALQHMTYVEFD